MFFQFSRIFMSVSLSRLHRSQQEKIIHASRFLKSLYSGKPKTSTNQIGYNQSDGNRIMDLRLLGMRLVQTQVQTMVQNLLFEMFIPVVVFKQRLFFVVNGSYAI